MEEVGVEAVVKGLQSFLGDMRKINSSVDGLRPSGSLLQNMFASLTEGIGNFGREVLNVAEVTLGVILRDVIEFIIRKFGELIQAIIETGNEFQLLKIRLTGLNLNDFADGTRSFADAMKMAGEKTKEELDWLQTLGSATPFDPAQIANTYTQARAFGFASDEAKRLTTDIINYTAGMGLSNETLFLVIQNLGQMVQRGKITGTEIRDLARGSFLPLSDVLGRIGKNLGMTTEQVSKMMVTPEGIPASEFVKAFEQMVEEEPRFVGAAGRMSRALVPAAQNVKELLTSIFGLNVATPIFDVLGEKVAGLVDQFAFFNEQGDLIKTQKWTDLVTAAQNLGKALTDVISDLLGFIPDASTLTDSLISGIQGVADWINAHREDIVTFFENLGNTIALMVSTVVAFVQDQLIPTFQRIVAWVQENGPLISEFFDALGSIVTTVLGNLFGGEFAKGDFLGGLLDAIKAFMEFVVENQEQIAIWATNLIKVWLAVEAIITVFNILIGVIGAVIGFVLSIIMGLASFVLTAFAVVSAITFLVANFWVLVAAIGVVIAIVGIVIQTILTMLTIKTVSDFIVGTFVPTIVAGFETMKTLVTNAVKNIVTTVKAIDWGGLGRSIIEGVANGIKSGAGLLIDAAVAAAKAAYDAALAFLQGGSPSKLFAELGEWTMVGFAQGITRYTNKVAGVMTDAMQTVSMPAMILPAMAASFVNASPASVTNNNTRNDNYNLTVNSAANREPIIQDYQMLKSLQGA